MQDTIQFLFKGEQYGLAHLLPQRFQPSDLLEDPAAPLLLLPQDNNIRLTPGAPSFPGFLPVEFPPPLLVDA